MLNYRCLLVEVEKPGKSGRELNLQTHNKASRIDLSLDKLGFSGTALADWTNFCGCFRLAVRYLVRANPAQQQQKCSPYVLWLSTCCLLSRAVMLPSFSPIFFYRDIQWTHIAKYHCELAPMRPTVGNVVDDPPYRSARSIIEEGLRPRNTRDQKCRSVGKLGMESEKTHQSKSLPLIAHYRIRSRGGLELMKHANPQWGDG